LINDLLERCLGDSPLPLIRDVPEDYPAEEPEGKVPDYSPNPDPYRADKKPCEHLVRAYRALAQMAKANENPQTCEEAERLYQLVKEYTIKRLQSDACHEVHKIKSGDHPTATANSLIWRKRVYNQMRDICNKEYQDIRDENDEIYRRMPEVPPNYAVAL